MSQQILWGGGSADCPGLPRPTWKSAPPALGLGASYGLGTRWAADVAERTEDTGPRLLYSPRRIYLSRYRPGEPGASLAELETTQVLNISISNRPDKPLGTHPVNWFLLEVQLCPDKTRLPNSRRYLPAQLVPAEVQPCQIDKVAQLRRYLPAQLVLAEVQTDVAAVVVRGDALPLADWYVAQPVIVFIPTGSIGGVIESDQPYPGQVRARSAPSSDRRWARSRTGVHPDLNIPYSTGSTNWLARTR